MRILSKQSATISATCMRNTECDCTERNQNLEKTERTADGHTLIDHITLIVQFANPVFGTEQLSRERTLGAKCMSATSGVVYPRFRQPCQSIVTKPHKYRVEHTVTSLIFMQASASRLPWTVRRTSWAPAGTPRNIASIPMHLKHTMIIQYLHQHSG